MEGEFRMPSRAVQIESPDSFGDNDSFHTELAPYLFTINSVVNMDGGPGLAPLVAGLSERLGVPVIDTEPEMLIAWWDGNCERTKRHIAVAGRSGIPALVIRY